MPSTTKQAALEAAYLIQAFVAAIECLQITALQYPWFGVYNFMYLTSPSRISLAKEKILF